LLGRAEGRRVFAQLASSVARARVRMARMSCDLPAIALAVWRPCLNALLIPCGALLPLRLDQAAGGGLDGGLDAGRSAELLACVVDMEIDSALR
jgi:hypothetical protein